MNAINMSETICIPFAREESASKARSQTDAKALGHRHRGGANLTEKRASGKQAEIKLR